MDLPGAISAYVLALVATSAVLHFDAKKRGLGEEMVQTRTASYMALALIALVLVLPVYFYATRKKMSAVLAGLAWAFGIALVAAIAVQPLVKYDQTDTRCEWREGLCAKGGASSCAIEALLWEDGTCGPPDATKARSFRNKACSLGDTSSCGK